MNMVNIAQDKFRHCMNPPENGFDGIAAVKILPETRILKMPYKCKNSKCRKEFIVHVWEV